MKKETINKLNMLQDFLAIMFAIIVIYMGFVWFGVPALAALVKVLLIIPLLEVPYSFFGYIFMFWLGITIFGFIVRVGIWSMNNFRSEEEKGCNKCEEDNE